MIFIPEMSCSKFSKREKEELNWQERVRVIILTPDRRRIEVDAEVAKTEEQRREGLMYRRELGQDEGMLFVMPYSSEHRFWMKNTLIPLDIIFIGEDKEVKGIIENARPESTEPLGISEQSRYVLEVNGGFCRKNGISKGAFVEFAGVQGK